MDESVLFSLRLSLQVAIAATVLVVLVGTGMSFILARKSFRGKEILDILLTLPLVLPPTVTGYYLILFMGRNGLLGNVLFRWTGWSIMFTWYAAVLASFIVALPLMIKTTRAAIESVDQNLIKVSYTLGHGELKTFFRVILPLSKKGNDRGGGPFVCQGHGRIRGHAYGCRKHSGENQHDAYCHLYLGEQR